MKLRKITFLIVISALLAGAMERQPNADYRARRVTLAKNLEGGAFILFAPTEPEGPNDLYGFRQEDNFYYLTGWSEPGAAVFVNANPYAEILFLPEHNVTQEKWTGPKLGPESPEAAKITGFDHVESLSKMRDELAKILPQPRVAVYSDLGSNGQSTASTGPMEWLRRSNAFPNYVSFRDAHAILTRLRTFKDEHEVQLITKASEASVAAHLAALKAIHPGVNEHDISALMQFEFEKRGCERPAYAPIVGSGFYSTVLHYSADDQVMKSGDLVVLDVAGEYSMYASDITRTAPVNGKFTPRQREIYDIVLGAQEAAMNAFELGKSKLSGQDPTSLYKVATDYINSHGKDLHGQPLGKYFIHGLGHPVGLNVHDPFDPSVPLAKGMVFTLEPGIYIGEEKLGVRIEDVFYVDPATGKLVTLSKGLPRTADEVEQVMGAH
ncbi:MAG TPA: Xaa-Pro peptidase family protein [Candidatus Limnocylindrales bacterium]|jgi:Xaa-Pro aminopeptidase|nr:Xaa-Pro peptidase family protein [Candidatus Limnocylindrales bacterium]